MKSLSIVSTVLIAALSLSCSKETELTNINQTNANESQLSSSNAFEVGQVNSDGSLTITYDMQELEELCACGVQEDGTANLQLTEENGIGFFLQGVGGSADGTTSFSIAMHLVNNKLMWEEGAFIAMCQNSSSTPCDLTVTDVEDFDCNGTPGSSTCYEDVTDGDDYPTSCGDTNWPWATKELDKKEDD